jgi:hypothetical protein
MLGILSAKVHQSTSLHGFPPSVERILLTNSKYCSLQAVPEAPVAAKHCARKQCAYTYRCIRSPVQQISYCLPLTFIQPSFSTTRIDPTERVQHKSPNHRPNGKKSNNARD